MVDDGGEFPGIDTHTRSVAHLTCTSPEVGSSRTTPLPNGVASIDTGEITFVRDTQTLTVLVQMTRLVCAKKLPMVLEV